MIRVVKRTDERSTTLSKKLSQSINQLDDLESLISDALIQTMDLKKTLQKINDFEFIK